MTDMTKTNEAVSLDLPGLRSAIRVLTPTFREWIGRVIDALEATPPAAKSEAPSQPGEKGAGVPIDVTKVPGYVTPAQSSETAAAHAKLGAPKDPCDCSACVKMRGRLYGDVPSASARELDTRLDAAWNTSRANAMRFEDEKSASAQQDEREAKHTVQAVKRLCAEIKQSLDIIDKRNGGACGATEAIHDKADAIVSILQAAQQVQTGGEAAS
ncbi:hypothetical protein [Cupriavidus campinensis]|uniref:Uncharacterized protein n=1 Tax=Cupriavidus campinensis TaxID=151783 RepID=A0ABY3EST9_9BURK|nr:hypothetical protein [Cupriavidus campinensis]TSP14038.1 hypothetical protein FGG12_06095 [Cupriavidus campinensis]